MKFPRDEREPAGVPAERLACTLTARLASIDDVFDHSPPQFSGLRRPNLLMPTGRFVQLVAWQAKRCFPVAVVLRRRYCKACLARGARGLSGDAAPLDWMTIARSVMARCFRSALQRNVAQTAAGQVVCAGAG